MKREGAWIIDKAVAQEEYGDCALYVVPGPFFQKPNSYGDGKPLGGLNGYAIFPKRITIESGYDGILTYVPVHGGITLADEMGDGRMVYGFDTGHCDSGGVPREDPDWVLSQCREMVDGIKAAAAIEADYLAAERLPLEERNKIRAGLIDNSALGGPHERSMGVCLKLLCGEL